MTAEDILAKHFPEEVLQWGLLLEPDVTRAVLLVLIQCLIERHHIDLQPLLLAAIASGGG